MKTFKEIYNETATQFDTMESIDKEITIDQQEAEKRTIAAIREIQHAKEVQRCKSKLKEVENELNSIITQFFIYEDELIELECLKVNYQMRLARLLGM